VLSFYRRKSPPGLELIRAIATGLHIYEVDISRDNRFLAIATSSDIHLYSLETGAQIWQTPAPQYIWSVDISPDGTKVAFGGESLVIVDIQNPSRRTEYFKFNNNINRVRFSPSGDAVFASSYDGHIRVIAADLSSPNGKLITTFRHGGTANVYEMDFTKDGRRMVSVSGDKTVRVWGGK
jgi:WD40 repeat protein